MSSNIYEILKQAKDENLSDIKIGDKVEAREPNGWSYGYGTVVDVTEEYDTHQSKKCDTKFQTLTLNYVVALRQDPEDFSVRKGKFLIKSFPAFQLTKVKEDA